MFHEWGFSRIYLPKRNQTSHDSTVSPSNGLAERTVRTVKTTLKKVGGGTTASIDCLNQGLTVFKTGNLETRLARVLMNHRRTPNYSGKSPAELMLGRTIRTRLDLCIPQQSQNTQAKLETRETNVVTPLASTAHKTAHTRKHQYQISDLVYARNFGKGNKWFKGTIVGRLGTVMFSIDTQDGIIRRHYNQIRKRTCDTHQERETTSTALCNTSSSRPWNLAPITAAKLTPRLVAGHSPPHPIQAPPPPMHRPSSAPVTAPGTPPVFPPMHKGTIQARLDFLPQRTQPQVPVSGVTETQTATPTKLSPLPPSSASQKKPFLPVRTQPARERNKPPRYRD